MVDALAPSCDTSRSLGRRSGQVFLSRQKRGIEGFSVLWGYYVGILLGYFIKFIFLCQLMQGKNKNKNKKKDFTKLTDESQVHCSSL